MNTVEELLSKTLKQNGLSLTGARSLTFSVLNSSSPLTVKEIITEIGNRADRASVYRSLAVFEQTNITQRIYTGWKYKIELSDKFNEHHHHLTCQKCGVIIPIHNRELEKFIENLASEEAFSTTSHQLEIQGLCSNCSKK